MVPGGAVGDLLRHRRRPGAVRERAFPKDERIALGNSQWLVRSDDSTTMFVWDRIMTQAAAPATPSGIVLAVNGYYGYREASIREWLAAKRRVGNGS